MSGPIIKAIRKTLNIRERTHKRLMKIQGRLQSAAERRVSMDETMGLVLNGIEKHYPKNNIEALLAFQLNKRPPPPSGLPKPDSLLNQDDL